MKSKRGEKSKIAFSIILLGIIILIMVVVLIAIKKTDGSLDKLTLKLKTEEVRIINENTLGVKIQVESGEGEISGISFIINNGEKSEIIEKDISLENLNGEIILNLKKTNLNENTKISASPIFKLNSGKTVVGKPGGEYLISEEYSEFIGHIEPDCTDTCLSLNYFCGDRAICGKIIDCGDCSGDLNCQTNGTCTIETCIVTNYIPELNTFCGTKNVTTNCGTTVEKTGILPCTSPSTCINNNCTCTTESDSTFCNRLNKKCGNITALDNCLNLRSFVNCGECTFPEVCSNGICQNTLSSIEKGMIAWWKFDLNLLDSIKTHSGTNYGATFIQNTECVSGQCANFDGFDDYIMINYVPDLNPGADLTIAAWIYWDGTSEEQNILTKEGCYEFRVEGGYINYATNPWAWRGGSSALISSNTWNHITITHDGDGQQVMYVNGIIKNSTTSGGDIFSNNQNLTIGGRLSAAAFFGGKIDDVKIWNRSLNSTEVKILFESYNYPPEDCTDTCVSLGYNCRSVCGVTCGNYNGGCQTGYSCQTNGTCTKDACTVTSYTPALNTFCGIRSVTTNCGTTVTMTGTLPCASPNTCVNNACVPPTTGAIIINHLTTDITKIPSSCVEKAKTLTFQYAHRSDGANILQGLNYVYNKDNDFRFAYSVNSLPSQTSPIRLRIMDGNPPEPSYSYADNYWNTSHGRTATANNWDSGLYTASMWSWCSEFNQGYLASYTANSYLNIMNNMESEHPEIKFVYMTSYGDTRDSNIAAANKIIRDYSNNNNKILYDFEDIGRCDPDGYCYSTATRDCNWCAAWCTSNPSYCTSLPSTCDHTHGLLCVQRANAFWWMMARLAGWDGNPSHGC
jgi:hypothetical protein